MSSLALFFLILGIGVAATITVFIITVITGAAVDIMWWTLPLGLTFIALIYNRVVETITKITWQNLVWSIIMILLAIIFLGIFALSVYSFRFYQKRHDEMYKDKKA